MRALPSSPQDGDYFSLYVMNLKASLLSPTRLISTQVPQILYLKDASEGVMVTLYIGSSIKAAA